jgi:nitrate reductase NapD
MNDEDQIGCIVGAIVQTKPGVGAVHQQLEKCDGVDIHGEDEQSRIVITMEAETSQEVMNLTDHIQSLDGVLSVMPVYQHNEEKEHQGGWKWR